MDAASRGVKRHWEDMGPENQFPAKTSMLLPQAFAPPAHSSPVGGTSDLNVALQANQLILDSDWSSGTSLFSARHLLPATLADDPCKISPATGGHSSQSCPAAFSDRSAEGSSSASGSATNSPQQQNEGSDAATSRPSSSTKTTEASTSTEGEQRTSIYKRRMMHYKRHDKPPYSYLGMIIVAIQYSPDQALSLSEVVKALPHMFPFFSGSYTGWKDSIRHNLSGNKCFEKVPSKVPSVSAKARCVNRWRIDWSRVPHDVFQLQRGRPGCSDPKWKPTLQQYLGLPDVFLPKQPKATQVKATANQMPGPSDFTSAADAGFWGSRFTLPTPYDSPFALPTPAPHWLWDMYRETGVDLSSSTKRETQKSDSNDLSAKSPLSDDLSALPRATSTPISKGSMSDALKYLCNFNGAKDPGSPTVSFPSIDNSSEQSASIPVPSLQTLPPQLRQLQVSENLHIDRSRHLSGRPLSSSSDLGYYTSEDSAGHGSFKFGAHCNQSATSQFQHPPQLSSPYYNSCSGYATWQPPTFSSFPSLPEVLAMQQMSSAHPFSSLQPYQYHATPQVPSCYSDCLLPPYMQFTGQGPAYQTNTSHPSSAPYGVPPIQGGFSHYPFQQQYPPYPPSQYPTSQFSARSPPLASSVFNPVPQPETQACGRDAKPKSAGDSQNSSGSNSGVSLLSLTQSVREAQEVAFTTMHQPLIYSDQPIAHLPGKSADASSLHTSASHGFSSDEEFSQHVMAKRPDTLAVQPLNLQSLDSEKKQKAIPRRASAELSAFLPKAEPPTFSPGSDSCANHDRISPSSCSTEYDPL
ncbi:hypothetical protein BaRGS_00036144 [Batillaria attramentaria]|uniref:Fork-head domain-containing protein n=1 Tax=Batillaria attramentaria TaxID=370345 RepID=A0ABD0JDJ1_9CAEN